MSSMVLESSRLGKFFNPVLFVLEYPAAVILKHFEQRLFESAMTLIMLSEWALIYLSPRSIEESAFRYMLHTVSATTICWTFFTIGLLRFVALVLNGHWMPWGAIARMVGALIGALTWAQWCAALFILYDAKGLAISPGVPVYGILALFEIVSLYRALDGALAAANGVGEDGKDNP